MSVECLMIAWRAELDPIDKLALIFIADGVGGGGLVTDNTPSGVAHVAAFCSISVERAAEAIQSLVAMGYLTTTVNGMGRVGLRVVAPGAPPEVEPLNAPRQARPDPANVAVYVLTHNFTDSQTVKVGISHNPARRCASVTSLTDLDLSVSYVSRRMTRRAALAVERAAHDALRAHRISGEFFSCGLDVARQAVIAAGGAA